MSYILEALKKAQAERQLGETPTIHAPTLDNPAGQAAQGPLRKPLVAALAGMGIVIVALAVVVWRQAGQGAAPAVEPVRAPAQVAAAPAMAATAPAMASPPVAAAPASLPSAAAPLAPLPPAAAAPAPPARKAEAAAVPAPSSPPAATVAAAAPAPAVAPVQPAREASPAAPPQAAAGAQAGAAEEPVQALRDLPEPIRRALPPLALSGYMYSPNPADRLILVDKVLRHEGEEVAPGLVLVRLEPKGAVFTFRGYRYRMPL